MRVSSDMFVKAITEIKTPIKIAKSSKLFRGWTIQNTLRDVGRGFLNMFKKQGGDTAVDREIEEIKKEAKGLLRKFVQVVCIPALPIVSLKFQYLKENSSLIAGFNNADAYDKLNQVDAAILRLYGDQVSIFNLD